MFYSVLREVISDEDVAAPPDDPVPDSARVRSFLAPLRRHLANHGVGPVSEILDGDAPFPPRGTPAPAWGAAQLWEAWAEIAAGTAGAWGRRATPGGDRSRRAADSQE